MGVFGGLLRWGLGRIWGVCGRKPGTRCIIYIMRRTQLYLDEDLWNILRVNARSRHTTVSELVRDAVRNRYLGKLEERRKAMQAIVGIRNDRTEFKDSEAYIRDLRAGTRIERFENE
jgi:hypothetical protein